MLQRTGNNIRGKSMARRDFAYTPGRPAAPDCDPGNSGFYGPDGRDCLEERLIPDEPEEIPDGYSADGEPEYAEEAWPEEDPELGYPAFPGAHSFARGSKSVKKHADAAYRSIAGTRAASAPHPWEDLDSGAVAWADFTPAEQESIARHYAPKVKYLAVRLKARLPRNIDLNDLISAGSMGLVESFSKFKPDLSVKFDTYAESRIRGAMLDELRRMDWFPRSLRQKVRQLDGAIAQIEQATGRSPSEEELAGLTGLSAKDVREGLEALQNQICFSLDTLENLLIGGEGDKRGEPFTETSSKEMLAKVADLIEQLTPREKLVLSLYYSEELNMREAAEVMGITEGRVSQLHSQALSKLRKEFNSLHGVQ
jgi:RNA polymerase sigma factor for flagellar operon FliA